MSADAVTADPYEAFARIFDRIVTQSKYPRWERAVRAAWRSHGLSPRSLADLACGTGNNAIRYAAEMTTYGVDQSPAMLSELRRKDVRGLVRPVQADMRHVMLPPVDAAICLDFSTNYLLTADDFTAFVRNTARWIRPGGLFVFDAKPFEAFPSKQRSEATEDYSFDWRCKPDDGRLVRIEIEIGLHQPDGSWQRWRENHVERGYAPDEVVRIAERAGVTVVDVELEGDGAVSVELARFTCLCP